MDAINVSRENEGVLRKEECWGVVIAHDAPRHLRVCFSFGFPPRAMQTAD